MEENTRLKFDEAQAEAIGVQEIAKQIEKNGMKEPATESLEEGSKLIDAIKSEYPENAQLIIEQTNKQRLLEVAADPNELDVLTKVSQSILDQDGSENFMNSLASTINDKNQVIKNLKNLFKNNASLRNIFEKKPKLEELWYEHVYSVIKAAMIVNAER